MIFVRWIAFVLRHGRLVPLRNESQAARDFMCHSMLGPEWLPPK